MSKQYKISEVVEIEGALHNYDIANVEFWLEYINRPFSKYDFALANKIKCCLKVIRKNDKLAALEIAATESVKEFINDLYIDKDILGVSDALVYDINATTDAFMLGKDRDTIFCAGLDLIEKIKTDRFILYVLAH